MKISAVLLVLLFASMPAFSQDVTAAKVNEAVITMNEVEDAVNGMIPQISYHGKVSDEKRNEFREKALQDLINRELQYQDAMARGLEPDKKMISAELQKIRDRFRSKRDYKAALKSAGITEKELKAGIAKNVLVAVAVERTVTEPSRMGDEAIREYFRVNAAKFVQPESVRLRMISAAAQSKAEAILERIRAGEDFSMLAAELSEDNYRIRGGDLGIIHKGRIFPDLEAEAFQKLKPGETSGLIRSGGLWYIIKVEDKQPERQMEFDEVKDKLRRDLEKKRADELMEQWLAGLRGRAKIEVMMKGPGDKGQEQEAGDGGQGTPDERQNEER